MLSITEQIKRLGKLVAKLRKERGLSQSELGRQTGSSQMTIQRLESGSGGTRLDTLVAIAQAFELSITDLWSHIEDAAIKKEWPKSELTPLFEELDALSRKQQKSIERIILSILEYSDKT